jgi:undecaprenyl-diphosphatase
MIFDSRRNENKQLNHLDAVLIGVAQGIALIPGVSRSGVTITTGLLRKVDKQSAFTFSFLLFMPAVVGATVLTFVEAGNLAAADIDIATVFFGIAVTVIVGYFFLKLLRRIVLRGRFQLFAFYCWAIGLIVLLTQVLGTL